MYTCRDCIIDHIRACGPQTRMELVQECETQATNYDAPTFEWSMIQLERDGLIDADTYMVAVESGAFVAWSLTKAGYDTPTLLNPNP